ncbi:unnamed protein product, partial [Rotaria sordida]
SVIMVTLLAEKTFLKSSYENIQSIWNYWQADSTLSMELNTHIPQLTQAENLFRSFESTLRDLHFDEKEFSLLLLMIITRHNLSLINDDDKSWSKCQYECVHAFSEYIQARRSNINGELSIEFYDIVFLVSQLRSLNRRITQCFMNLPWPYVRNLPSFFYRIYVPNFDSSPSAKLLIQFLSTMENLENIYITNKNIDQLQLSRKRNKEIKHAYSHTIVRTKTARYKIERIGPLLTPPKLKVTTIVIGNDSTKLIMTPKWFKVDDEEKILKNIKYPPNITENRPYNTIARFRAV